MSDVKYITITEEEAPQRLDNYLLKILKGVPKSRIYRIIRQGEVRINKKRAKPDTRLQAGDILRIPPVRVAESNQEVFVSQRLGETLLAHILYEDDKMIVLNKPSGIAVHGGSGVSLGVVEALRKLRTDLHYLELVHRLDRETSGCLLLAKKRSALRALHDMLQQKTVTKTYWALCAKTWVGKHSKVVDAPLTKNVLKSGERVVRVDEAGKASKTNFKLLENFKTACLLEASPLTGRTHQIRVHCLTLGHPILGDEKYGEKAGLSEGVKAQRLYLHAKAIAFTLDDKTYRFEAPLEQHFEQGLKHLRQLDKE